MPRTSCIPHPECEKLILIRKWQLEACEKDACAAALLNLFEYWHNIKLEQTTQAKTYNEISQRHGENSTQIETLLQWHTTEQLESSLLYIFNKRRIQAGIEILKNLKFISVHRNPNPRYAFDKTKHFLLHPHEIRSWIKDYASKNTDLKFDEDEQNEGDLSMDQKEMIDSDDLHRSIEAKCTNDDAKNNRPLIEIDPSAGANCPKQYTKNTYQDYLDILPKKTHPPTNYLRETNSSLAFNIFWGKWVELTRKSVSKNKAFEIFSNLVKNEEDPLLNLILTALENQTQEKELRQRLNLFTPQWPNPSGWLSEARWEDEVHLDEEFYQAEILRCSSGLIQNKQNTKQQREYFLDGQYKESITRTQNESNQITTRQEAIKKFDEEFRSRKRN